MKTVTKTAAPKSKKKPAPKIVAEPTDADVEATLTEMKRLREAVAIKAYMTMAPCDPVADFRAEVSVAGKEVVAITELLRQAMERMGDWYDGHGRDCDCDFCSHGGRGEVAEASLRGLGWAIGQAVDYLESLEVQVYPPYLVAYLRGELPVATDPSTPKVSSGIRPTS